MRFVILHHQVENGEHWDFMLEAGGVLRTWQLFREPTGIDAVPLPARRIGDHRKAYLEYEGPLKGGRGQVTRVDQGVYDVESESPGRLVIQLSGRRLRGRVVLQRHGDGWVLDNATAT